MTIPSNDVYLTLWYAALEAEIGILIETGEPKNVMNDLYRVRDAQADPELQSLLIMTDPRGTGVWICKKQTSLLER